jgi:hypothetical protein
VRLQQHLLGIPAGRNYVTRCGGHLRPDLYEFPPQYATREEAESAEAALASALRKQSYRVFGGH